VLLAIGVRVQKAFAVVQKSHDNSLKSRYKTAEPGAQSHIVNEL